VKTRVAISAVRDAFLVAMVIALCALVVGCAGLNVSRRCETNAAGCMNAEVISPQRAQDAIAAGKSKADITAALGKAIEIKFDSGYEVWVYRWKGNQRTTRGDTELVVLFAPSGAVKKWRVRPPYPPEA
jgi:DUF971 family protein